MSDSIKNKNSSKIKKTKDDATINELLEPLKNMNLKEQIDNNSKLHWNWNFRVLISNLFMKTERRLPGACVPSCLRNTRQCVWKHRCAKLPDGPNFMSAEALRNTLYCQQYNTFLDIVEIMILQGTYPGDGILDRMIHMAMILTNKGVSVVELCNIYMKLLRTFYLLIDAFPPCWTALRPYYMNFLGIENPLIPAKRFEATPQRLQLYLNLLEKIIPECSDEEISELTNFYQKHVYNFTEEEDANLSQDTVFLRHVQAYDWKSDKLSLDDFNVLQASVRLARVFDVINMLSSVLEMEFLSWLDHNRKRQSSEEIFQEETKPFAVWVFGMQPNIHLTEIVRQVMRLFSLAAAKSLYWERLNILQRLISLIMEVSNTAEIEYINNAVIYPMLGPLTFQLIADFFKIFKAHNGKNISTYLKIIPLLQQPYLRFHFTEHFLQMFHYTKNLPFGPQKICEEFKTKQWLNYKPKAEIANEQLSCEDYLLVLLNELKDYCQWLDLATFWKYLKTKDEIQPLQTKSSTPVSKVVAKISPTDEIQKEGGISTKVIMVKSKVNLPVAEIHVASMCGRYGNDIHELLQLKRLLQNEVASLVDISTWLTYLNDLLG